VRRARVDSNQYAIITALRQAGCSVQPLHTVGAGCPDLLVGRITETAAWYENSYNFLLEIKDGSKPPSRRKLTPDEQRWHIAWKGQVTVVSSVDEALAAVGVE